MAFGWSETLQSLVSGFAEIVVVQTTDFGEWFLVMMGAYFGVPGFLVVTDHYIHRK